MGIKITDLTAEPAHTNGTVRSPNEDLLVSELRYRRLFEAARDGIFLLDIDTLTITDGNPFMTELLGYSRDEFLGKEVWELGLFSDKEESKEAFRTVRKNGYLRYDDLPLITKQGESREVEFVSNVYNEGKVKVIQCNIRDITERRIAEAALEDAEHNYRDIFENAVEGIFQSTGEGRFMSVNPAMARILGYDSPQELLADRFDIGTQHYVDPDCRVELHKILTEHEVAKGFECEIFRRDRKKIWTQVNIRTVRNVDGDLLHYEGSLEEITARKSLEGQLRQSQKMEAVGVLAGGIAHDFNNLLTAINGYSALTLRRMAADDPSRHYIEQVKNAGERAAELTGQLLAFSRKQVFQPIVVNLNTVVTNIQKMLRRIIRESIELRYVLEPKLKNVKADPGQIEQVIMNLAINARDAMANGGTFTLETENVDLDEDYVNQHGFVSAGEFIKLTVTDTGEGMDASTQSHIFEPFFTTKMIGKGTGLGLSTVYGIVKQSGGNILVYSERGHGTTFKIYLPCVVDGIEEDTWIAEPESCKGTETILLVEDEEIVRTFVMTILSENGYNVIEASNGIDAINIARSGTEQIHMLLSDVIMPKMSGTELNDQLVKIRPDIKSLFMSGYTDDSISHQGVLRSGTAFIEKPFSPEALFRKIREVFESRAISTV